MEKTQAEYSPWERTDAHDLQIMQALDNASETQLTGLVDELFSLADALPDEQDAA